MVASLPCSRRPSSPGESDLSTATEPTLIGCDVGDESGDLCQKRRASARTHGVARTTEVRRSLGILLRRWQCTVLETVTGRRTSCPTRSARCCTACPTQAVSALRPGAAPATTVARLNAHQPGCSDCTPRDSRHSTLHDNVILFLKKKRCSGCSKICTFQNKINVLLAITD